MRRARIGSIGRRPTPRTGGGMKLATKKPPIRGPKPTDTGGRVVTPKKKPPIRGPKSTDTGGRLVTPKKKPPTPRVSDTGTGLRRPRRAVRSGNDGLTPVRRAGMMKRLADQRSSANQRRRARPMRRRARPMRRR